jgi:GNAT superfamily N-acetyltransferase
MSRHASYEPSPALPLCNVPPGWRVRTWPGEPGVAHLVMYGSHLIPSVDTMRAIVTELDAQRDISGIRTGAMPASFAPAMEGAGFHPRQQLTLLEHGGPLDWTGRAPGFFRRVVAPRIRTQRAAAGDFTEMARIDHLAFDTPWQLDADGIADVLTATPKTRARLVRTHGTVQAFAISGRDRFTGYLQRLSVDPAMHRQGIGRALVADSLQWMWRQGVYRCLVNTHVGNEPALALYGSVGFVAVPEQLTVYERALQ